MLAVYASKLAWLIYIAYLMYSESRLAPMHALKKLLELYILRLHAYKLYYTHNVSTSAVSWCIILYYRVTLNS